MTEPAIALEGLERRYGERVALHGVTLTPPAGRHTRCARSPTGRARPPSCACWRPCCDRTRAPPPCSVRRCPADGWKVRGRVGYLGHDPLLYRELSGRENLVYHARLHGVDAGASGGAPECGWPGTPRRRPGARPLEGDGPAPGRGPSHAARPRPAAARRAAGQPRPRGGRGPRASDRRGRRAGRGCW